MKRAKEIVNICLYIAVFAGMVAPLFCNTGEEFKVERCLLYANLSAALLILNKMEDGK